MIAIDFYPAGTIMNTNTQIFLNDLSTIRANLRCSFGINSDQRPTSFFRFIGQKIKEHRPCCIIDVLVQNFVLAVEHLFWLQGLNKYRSKSIYDIPAQFVQKVFALVADFGMQAGKAFSGFAGALLGVFALKFFKLVLAVFEMLRIINNFTIGQHGKRLDADINSDFIGAGSKALGSNLITGKGGVEMPVLSLNCNGLNPAFQISVQSNSNASNVLDVKFAVFQPNTVAVSREGDRIKPIPCLEPGEAGLLAGFDTPEESLKRFVQASKNILRCRVIELRDVVVKAADFLEGIGLVVIVDRLMPLLPTNNAMLQGGVIKKASGIKKAFQLDFLSRVRKKPIFESFAHLFTLLIFDVFLNSRFADMSDAASIIAATPKGRQFAAQFLKLPAQDPAGIPFQAIHDFGNTPGGIMLKKQVNVVRHYFKRVDCEFEFIRFFTQQLFESLRYYTGQHLAAIFRAPDNMQFQAENGPGIFGISIHATNIHMSDMYVNNNQEERSGHSSAP